MGLFRTDPKPIPEDLLRRLDRLEATMSMLQQEWTSVLDQVSRHFARHRKRVRDEMREAERLEPTPGGTEMPQLVPNVPPGVLARRRGH